MRISDWSSDVCSSDLKSGRSTVSSLSALFRPTMMKTSLDHLPPQKQRELARVLEILHEEFEDALKGSSSNWKKRGRILKVILFGSYARGAWVDEPDRKSTRLNSSH